MSVPPDEPLRTTARSADAPPPPGVAPSNTIPEATPVTEEFSTEIAVPGYEVPASAKSKRGGMGVVYVARHVALDREVAIKTLIPGRAVEPRIAQRFVTESRVTAKLSHPGVPPVFEVGQLRDGRPYLVMKFIRGEDLSDLLKARPNPAHDLPRFIAVFEQICQTVGYAHSVGVIHRDLKPANVMVGEFGEVQVMDWGIARVGDREQGTGNSEATGEFDVGAGSTEADEHIALTRAGTAMGTPAYMAPEQARGEWDKVNSRADVFALGGVLTDVLTGQPPFVGDTAQHTLILAGTGKVEPAFARLDASGADPELIALAKWCLAPKLEARPADGKAVADAVAAYRTGVEARFRKAEAERAAAAAKAEAEHRRAAAEAQAKTAAEARAAAEKKAKRAAEDRADEADRRAEAEAAQARAQRSRRRWQLAAVVAGAWILFGSGALALWRGSVAIEEEAEKKAAAAKEDAEKARRAKEEAEQKLALQKAEAERNAAVERARSGVASALKLAGELRAQHKFREAEAALAQADDLAKALGTDDLKKEIQRAKADLAFARELEAIRARKWAWVPAADGDGGTFDSESAPAAYAAAFAKHGIDVNKGDPETLAKQIKGSPIKADLLRALDDWALDEKSHATGEKVSDLARRADPTAVLANRLRDRSLIRDRTKTPPFPQLAEDLVESAPVALLATALMERRGENPSVVLAIAFAKHPTDFDLALALALWFHDRDAPKAIGYYRAARALRPEHATVLTNLGLLLSSNGENGAAVAVLKEAVRLHPNDHVAHFNLGGAYSHRRDYPKAEHEYRETIRLNPKYADAYSNLGAVLGRTKQTDEALKVLAEAVELAPKNVRVRINYGAALQNSDKLDDALVQFLEAVKIGPKYAPAHHALGVCYVAKGDRAAAEKCFREAARLDPKQYGDLAKKPPEK